MKKIIYLIIVFAPLIALSQRDNVENISTENQEILMQLDSLKLLITNEKSPIENLSHITKVQRLYQSINADSALAYSDREIQLSQKTENLNLVANARLEKSIVLWRIIAPDLAIELLQANIENKRFIADTIIAKSYLILARVKVQKKLPTESFLHTLSASEIYAQMNDSINLSSCFAFIAGLHVFALAEPAKAIPYFEKALVYNNNKNKAETIRIFINYSTALRNLERYDDALEKNRNADMLAIKHDINAFDASIAIQYALIYNTTEDYEKSLKYSLKADSIQQNGSNYDLRTQEKVNWYLALNYKALGNYEKAIFYFKKIENTQLLDSWTVKSELIEIYKETGEFEKAFLLQEEVLVAIDSTNELERTQKLKEITEKYENEKNKKEIAELNTEKEFQKNEIRQREVILFGTICFFIALIGFGIYRYKSKSKLKETVQNLERAKIQHRFLRTQLNPHFFFHALTSIESYIAENDKVTATAYLHEFSSLMRKTLEFSDLDFISLHQDIEFIKKYIRLQQLNHDFQFDYEIEVSDKLDRIKTQVPPMLIQPAVENAILHGALSTEDGVIKIDYIKNGNQLEIKISDNGKTRPPTPASRNKLNRSMSTDITKKRIKSIRQERGINIQYNTEMDQNGTTVIFNIPEVNHKP